MLNQEFAVVKRVRTAVFPVAGLGTRFLPATKALPKEMLTVVDRPLIQYAVDEAREAGIDHFVFVTGRNKGVIEDHFDRQFELETTLEVRGKVAALSELRKDLPSAGRTSFTRQQEPLGLGHAVWCAREIVGNEPFALLLPDMLFRGKRGVLKQMMETYEETGGNVIAVEQVPPAEISSYGVVARGEGPDAGFRITGMVEKPKREEAPSNLIISGRYILQPDIFTLLADQPRGAGGEIQLTDAMQTLMQQQPFVGVQYEGQSFDCGSKIGFLTANVAYALGREDIAGDFLAALSKLRLDAALSDGLRHAAE
ncbi:MAG: UTP--glucose-1-phosphate uridylyltransferase GalU [Alphaproteobacteria bacterium]|jgi:UTP--glucose-1-phosphate uridylyltransferase|uniref:UTP--glucose-1-phosphate uridylyltransferase GalU n=1 Tax=Devosia sp. XGJD_8 TaxID=3391187 RepID=UPI001D1A7B54|nr:UTP--glucose-1-phosphate uridylyltransferase GalU [Alphaproteobacteria bacterium]MBU1562516.1 UTP--glucose-1-phosphate uridylyltransferase GalU [Alphaproteobacteria bacterium]MBU2304019.1 UTP--glucose-1-phosphate uridylyltransferase GalU [Alphaproteobacteria bacterium]MBU2369081.1 UTP--glucose-1-phosphate uridylyltransferase GalU [Alphaproteobacteria bacterium]